MKRKYDGAPPIRINVCHIDDPADPATWSRIPFSIQRELKRRGALGAAFAAGKGIKLWFPMPYIAALLQKLIHKGRALLAEAPGPLKKRAILGTCRLLLFLHDAGSHCHDRMLKRRYKNNAIRLTAQAPTSVTLHTTSYSMPLHPQRGQSHFVFVDSFYEQDVPFLRNALHVFVAGKHVKEVLARHGYLPAEKITPVALGINVEPFTGEKDYSGDIQVLFCCKNHFLRQGGVEAMNAFAIAQRKDPRLRLTVVGMREYPPGTKRDVPNTKFYGYISREELQRLYNESHVLFMPAHEQVWGMVFAEALSCKMPIIGLNRYSFNEISDNGKYGVALEKDDPDGMADALLELCTQPDKMRRMGEAGQRHALQNYTWEKVVGRMLEKIQEYTNDVPSEYRKQHMDS